MKTGLLITPLLAVLITTLGCTNENSDSLNTENTLFEQINYGSEMCEFSNEVIETVRYGGRIELEDEGVYNFMSVECLAGFYLNLQDKSIVKSMKVVDFTHGKRLLPVHEMIFLHSSLRPVQTACISPLLRQLMKKW